MTTVAQAFLRNEIKLDSPLREFPKQAKSIILPGPCGELEAATTWPSQKKAQGVAVVCHPHPLFDGTMNNKVVTTLVRTFNEMELAAVRFNFRGVGRSVGKYGEGVGEIEDLAAVVNWVQKVEPELPLWLAGFSFGSYIAACLANRLDNVKQLVSVAPPVHHFDFTSLTHIKCSWLIVQGDQDEVVSCHEVKAFAANPPSPLQFEVLPGVGHFFHGKLIMLKELLLQRLSHY